MEETGSLTAALLNKKPRGYGAAVANTATMNGGLLTPRRVVSHKLTKSDTLSSLAIMYGSTVGDIKRFNKLYNNDSLTFKHIVDIPIYGDNDDSISAAPSTSISSSRPAAAAAALQLNADHVAIMIQTPDSSGANGLDFLTKFDKSLSVIRKKVEDQTTGDSLSYFEEDDVVYDSMNLHSSSDDNSIASKRSPTSVSQRSSTASVSTVDHDDIRLTPQPVIRSKARIQLAKHEQRQNEELFTL